MLLRADRPMKSSEHSQVTSGPALDSPGENDPVVAGFLAALDLVGNGGAFLNHDGRVIAANAKARSYLGQLAPALRDGRISGLDRTSDEALQRLLAIFVHNSRHGGTSAVAS